MQISSKINACCSGQCFYFSTSLCFVTNLTLLLKTTPQSFVSAYCCFAQHFLIMLCLIPLMSFQTFQPDSGVNSYPQRVPAVKLCNLPRLACFSPSISDGTQWHCIIYNPEVQIGSNKVTAKLAKVIA